MSNAALGNALRDFINGQRSLTPTFVSRFLQRLRQAAGAFPPLIWLEQWLAEEGLSADDAAARATQRLALTQLVMANSITSLRAIGRRDWRVFVERQSRIEAVLLEDPSAMYRARSPLPRAMGIATKSSGWPSAPGSTRRRSRVARSSWRRQPPMVRASRCDRSATGPRRVLPRGPRGGRARGRHRLPPDAGGRLHRARVAPPECGVRRWDRRRHRDCPRPPARHGGPRRGWPGWPSCSSRCSRPATSP